MDHTAIQTIQRCLLRYGHISRQNNAARDSPAKPCNTVHSDAAARFLSKLVAEQLEPVFHDLVGRRGTVIEGPVLEETKEKKKSKHVSA